MNNERCKATIDEVFATIKDSAYVKRKKPGAMRLLINGLFRY